MINWPNELYTDSMLTYYYSPDSCNCESVALHEQGVNPTVILLKNILKAFTQEIKIFSRANGSGSIHFPKMNLPYRLVADQFAPKRTKFLCETMKEKNIGFNRIR